MRLSLGMVAVLLAAATSVVCAEEIAAVPEAAWEGARLAPVAAFRLLEFAYPVNAYLQSVRGEGPAHPSLRRRATWVAVYRRGYTVWRQDLTRDGYRLLGQVAAGVPLGKAVADALTAGRGKRPGTAELFDWFRGWVGAGMFGGVKTG